MVTEWFGVFVVIKDLTCVKTVKDKIKIKKKSGNGLQHQQDC